MFFLTFLVEHDLTVILSRICAAAPAVLPLTRKGKGARCNSIFPAYPFFSCRLVNLLWEYAVELKVSSRSAGQHTVSCMSATDRRCCQVAGPGRS